MRILVYYFSGTGNSLLAARKITCHLKGAVLKPVSELYKMVEEIDTFDSTSLEETVIGFVFPVYYDRIPQIIKEAIEKAPFKKIQYCFGVTTSGGVAGNALYELDSVLKSRGLRLDYGKDIKFSDNSIALRTSETKAAERLAQLDKVVEEIVLSVSNLKKIDKPLKRKRIYSAIGWSSRLIAVKFYHIEHKKIDLARCSQCNICASICPTENIFVKNGEICFGGNCQQCFACINWCPNKAIIFGKLDPIKKSQYHCPGINRKDLKRV